MAAGKDGFAKIASSNPVKPIPDFPKLPQCLKKYLKPEELKEVETYEFEVQEFFKKQAQRNF